jgi:non-ribosomal peptide synthase protein (TIGR01720 family)
LGRHLVDITGMVKDGELKFSWSFSGSVFRVATIERLAIQFARSLSALASHCEQIHSATYTPSDFPTARIDEPELKRVLAILESREKRPRSTGRPERGSQ